MTTQTETTAIYGRAEYGRVWHYMVNERTPLCGMPLLSPLTQNTKPAGRLCKRCVEMYEFRQRMNAEARP